ncbi:MAG TPA: acetylxylan esterase [Gaiellaceae bacterium]
MRFLAAAVSLNLLLAGCGGGAGEQAHARPALFDYDRSAPLGFRDRGRINHGYPIAVRDISYASPKGGRVPGYLIVPPGRGRHPAVIYMHGSGGTRLDFVVPGTWMAARGAVALTIASPSARSREAARPGTQSLERERDLTVQNVVDLRRAVDVLRSLPEVDPNRIAYVGYSAGARTGAILAGVEHRITAYDLLSGGASPPAEYARAAPRRLRAGIVRVLSSVDPLRYVRRAAPAALLFQDGRRDRVVPRRALLALARACSRPKQVRWYDAGHGLDARAYRDQLRWLSARLGLEGPVVPGAVTGP